MKRFYKNIQKRYHIQREKPQFWYFPDQNFGYIQIPKVASRSIREALHKSLGLPACEDQLFDQFEKKYSAHLSQNKIRRVARNSFIFAVVRHPLARLHSAYINKIVIPQQTGGRNIFHCHGIRFGMSFEEFIERVYRIPDRKIDRHLRSQSWFLCTSHGALIPDFIAQLESFDKDWGKLRQKIPSLGSIPHKNKATSGKDYSSAYTPETENLARERYAMDFKLFDYE